MVQIKIKVLVYGTAAGKDYKLGEIADVPAEEAERAVEANVADWAGAKPAPSEAEDEEDEFGGESVKTPSKKTGKGR